jgi:tRNA-specific 2-thiouridylase
LPLAAARRPQAELVTGLVIVGMSGGVDSAVAAMLLKEQGREVQGLFMSNWEEDEDGYCTAAADFQDARRVCDEIGITLHRASFAREYRDRVFAHFLGEYAAGRTPNPDVLCNREIKFGVCFDFARRLGAATFATGHYARLARTGEHPRLLRARDRGKDQSYFLHAVAGTQLAGAEFPVGDLQKADLRRLARDRGLPVFDKKDSTGICFIGERPFREFLANYLPAQPGNIEAADGERLGEHRGLMFYTLGQRAGLGLGGRRGAADSPWYVAAKDLGRNVLIVVQGHDHPLLLSDSLVTGPAAWVAGRPPAREFACSAQFRYRQRELSCHVRVLDDGATAVRYEIPQRAVTPGQYAVFYDGEECLGGAVIASAQQAAAARRPRATGYN